MARIIHGSAEVATLLRATQKTLHTPAATLTAMPKEKPKPGPKAERLKLEGDWKERLREAVQKKSEKKPKEGPQGS